MLKLICPDREDLQVLGTTLGAALPMNIYISQTVGNEPMAGCFTAVAVVFAMKLLCVTGSTASAVNWRVIGLFLGLAMLTKVTAVLLFPVFVIALWYVFVRDGRTLKQTAVAWLEVFGIALAVSGWYYVRNWIVLGRPFVGGWEPGRGIDWWQSPGYRVPGHFLRFGASLIYPIYSGVSGLWDSLYSTFWLDGWLSSAYLFESRPPWNYDWMVAGSVLAAVPSLAIIVGGVVAICCPAPRCAAALRFAVGCVATYLLALAALYLQLPIFSTAKATYTLGLLPCYVALGAIGFGSLMRGPLSRAAISAWMVCWACSAYLAFFVH